MRFKEQVRERHVGRKTLKTEEAWQIQGSTRTNINTIRRKSIVLVLLDKLTVINQSLLIKEYVGSLRIS